MSCLPTGGESIYGRPFEDEFHSRLRFTRRGLVAMASSGPNTNRSQFFVTFGRTDELDRKHTIFGKVGTAAHAFSLPAILTDSVGRQRRASTAPRRVTRLPAPPCTT